MSTPGAGAHGETPLTDELAELLVAAQGWVSRATANHQVATGASECTGCPLCRLISVLRGDRPEVTEKMLDVVNSVVTGLRGAFEAPPAEPASDPAASPASDPAPPSRVQPIDLTDPEED